MRTNGNCLTVVTGASGTLGEAVCTRLLAEDHIVIGIGRMGGRTIPRILTDQAKFKPLYLDLSISFDISQLTDIFSKEVTANTPRHINLVHTAGRHLVQQMKESGVLTDQWGELFQIHCGALFSLASALLPHWKQLQSGTIVSVSSNLTLRVTRDRSLYICTKAGMEALTRQLAFELGEFNVSCNCVAPGFFIGGMSEYVTAEKRQAILRNTPLKRIATSEMVSDMICLMLEKEHQWVTGQVICLDGGNCLGFPID